MMTFFSFKLSANDRKAVALWFTIGSLIENNFRISRDRSVVYFHAIKSSRIIETLTEVVLEMKCKFLIREINTRINI